LTKAFPRICAIDSRRWLKFLMEILPIADEISEGMLSEAEIRMLQMFQFTVWQKSAEDSGFDSIIEGLKIIK